MLDVLVILSGGTTSVFTNVRSQKLLVLWPVNLHWTSTLSVLENLSHILLFFACFGFFFLLINSLLESDYFAFVTVWNTFTLNSWVLNCCPRLLCTAVLKELNLLLSSTSFLTCSSKYKNKNYKYMLRLPEPGDNRFLIFSQCILIIHPYVCAM